MVVFCLAVEGWDAVPYTVLQGLRPTTSETLSYIEHVNPKS